jgi:hypothetical protein
MERMEYGSTLSTMNTCTSARSTSSSIDTKCQYRAHTNPPNTPVSGASDTGFQMASPVSTTRAPTAGITKYAPFCSALCLPCRG